MSNSQKAKTAETKEEVKELLTNRPHIDSTELNNEIDKGHQLPLTNKQKQTEKTSSTHSLSNSALYSVNANMIFSATSEDQKYQNKTREKSLYPNKYVLTTYFTKF